MNITIPEALLRNPSVLLSELNPVDKGYYFLMLCPSCGKKEAFLYKGKRNIVCNRQNKCGYSSGILHYLKEDRGLSEKEIVSLFSKSRVDGPFEEVVVEINRDLVLPENVRYFFETESGMIRDRAYNYLKNRNIPEKNILELGYVYDPGCDYHNRVFIPFYENGGIVYFTARDFTGTQFLRYRDPAGINKHNFVFNIDKIEEGGDVFIFEGLMDAMSLEDQIGTAMLTSTLGREQIRKIFDKGPRNIIFIPDIDIAGLTTHDRNIKLLYKFKPPSLELNVYTYWFSKERYNAVRKIMAKELLREKKAEMIDELDLPKDFNETGLNSIDLGDCDPYKPWNLNSMIWQSRKPF